MDNSIIYNNIKNYLIDKNINTNDEDNTFINKLKYSLLKDKRIIAIILLIILLFIGYQCNISFLDTNTNSYNLKGGGQSVIAGKLSSAMNSLGTTLKSGKIDALKSGASETYDFGDKWGVLYIQNKNTGETIKIIKSFKLEQDFKHSNDLEVLSGADAEDFEDCFK